MISWPSRHIPSPNNKGRPQNHRLKPAPPGSLPPAAPAVRGLAKRHGPNPKSTKQPTEVEDRAPSFLNMMPGFDICGYKCTRIRKPFGGYLLGICWLIYLLPKDPHLQAARASPEVACFAPSASPPPRYFCRKQHTVWWISPDIGAGKLEEATSSRLRGEWRGDLLHLQGRKASFTLPMLGGRVLSDKHERNIGAKGNTNTNRQ